jgi:hypothetical protein
VQTCEGLREPLVVAGEAAEAGGPGEGPLDHPAPGQQDEAALGLWRADHVEGDAVDAGGFGWSGTGVALIDVG